MAEKPNLESSRNGRPKDSLTQPYRDLNQGVREAKGVFLEVQEVVTAIRKAQGELPASPHQRRELALEVLRTIGFEIAAMVSAIRRLNDAVASAFRTGRDDMMRLALTTTREVANDLHGSRERLSAVLSRLKEAAQAHLAESPVFNSAAADTPRTEEDDQ